MATMIERQDITIGAMEVYFMGVRLFSKKLSNVWPNNTLVAQKCLRAYEGVVAGGSPSEWEHIKPVKASLAFPDLLSPTGP